VETLQPAVLQYILFKNSMIIYVVEHLDHFSCLLQVTVCNFVTELKKYSLFKCELEQPSSELCIIRMFCSFGRI
jgi:hypothetical protein